MKYVFYNEHGRIISVKEMPEGDIEYYSGDYIPTELQNVNSSSHYVDNAGDLVNKPTKPNDFAVFDYINKTWSISLSDEVKVILISRIKTEANILILAAYKSTKQTNMQSRYLELLTDGLSSSAEALLLRSAWDWVKQVRNASNAAELLIEEAATLEAAELISANAYISIGAAPTISS